MNERMGWLDHDKDAVVVAVAEPVEGHVASLRHHGSNEQIFGADEQVPGRRQSD